MSTDVVVASVTEHAARVLTDEVKADASALWVRFLDLHDAGVHAALGYSSWSDYCAAEFDMSKPMAYRVINAGRVVASLSEFPNGNSALTESHARQLVPLVEDAPRLKLAAETAQATAAAEDRPATAKDYAAATKYAKNVPDEDVNQAATPLPPAEESVPANNPHAYVACPTCGHRLRADKPLPTNRGNHS
jgi:hypothetical protein